MKALFFTLPLIFISFLCFAAVNNDKEVDNPTQKTALVYQGKDRVMLHEPNTSRVIIVQYEKPINLDGFSIVQADIKTKEVTLKNIKNDNIERITVGKNIVGIAFVDNSPLFDNLVVNGKIVPSVGDDIFAISCGCNTNGSDDSECTSGGENASQCEYSYGGNAGPVGGQGSCNVTCNAGSYACCHM